MKHKHNTILLIISLVIILMLQACASGSGTGEKVDEPEAINAPMETEEPEEPETMEPAEPPTATPTEEPVASISQAVEEALVWEVLYMEDFSQESESWFVGEVEGDELTQTREITDGQYLISLDVFEDLEDGWEVLGVIRDVQAHLYDFLFSVNTGLVEGSTEIAYGVAFRFTPEGYYMFTIRDDAFRLALVRTPDVQVLVDWTPSEAIRPGEMNELTVVSNSSELILLINEEVVAEVVDDQLSSGLFFLVLDLKTAGERAVVAFDDLLIRSRAQTIRTMVQDWPVILEEDFLSNDLNWPEGDQSDSSRSVTAAFDSGKYRVEMSSNDGFAQFSAVPDLDIPVDMFLTAEVIRESGSQGAEAGLTFKNQNGNFYRFTVHSDEFGGLMSVLLFQNGEWTWLLNRRSIFVRRGFGDINQLGVIASGDHFVFLINDSIAAEINDTQLAMGGAGLVAGLAESGDQAVWTFGNVRVYGE